MGQILLSRNWRCACRSISTSVQLPFLFTEHCCINVVMVLLISDHRYGNFLNSLCHSGNFRSSLWNFPLFSPPVCSSIVFYYMEWNIYFFPLLMSLEFSIALVETRKFPLKNAMAGFKKEIIGNVLLLLILKRMESKSCQSIKKSQHFSKLNVALL